MKETAAAANEATETRRKSSGGIFGRRNLPWKSSAMHCMAADARRTAKEMAALWSEKRERKPERFPRTGAES